MKKIVLAALILFAACKKEETKPSQPTENNKRLIIYRAYGFEKLDSALIFKNGVFISNNPSGYNVDTMKGDLISFRIFGAAKDSAANFAIWKNENDLPANSIQTFYSKDGFISGSYLIK